MSAIILDYGGPALLKVIKEQIGGPSLQTTYATVQCDIPTLTKLESIFGKAASYNDRIGYKGPFILAIDATAILPSLRVKENKVIGVASELDVFVHTALDMTEKAQLANAFVLTPVQKHAPSYVLAISPVVKGQDFATGTNWFNTVFNHGDQQHLQVIGIGADGDTKFLKC